MNTNFKKTFGTRIRYLRNLSGLSQEELAEKVGLSSKTISYIENGKNNISFGKIPLLANGLGVPIYKLFIFADNENSLENIKTLLDSASNKEINVIENIIKTILAMK